MTSQLPVPAFLAIGVAMMSSVGQLLSANLPSFEKDILPVFYHHCFACHSEKQAKPKGKLRLDLAEAIRGSDVIVPGKPDEDELLKRVSLPHSDEDVMPPLKGGAQPLNDEERAMLRQWIADGAKMDSWVKFDHRGAALPKSDAALAHADAIAIRDMTTGAIQTVRKADAAKIQTDGTLMPDGLTVGLTEQDLAHLVRYLSELGK